MDIQKVTENRIVKMKGWIGHSVRHAPRDTMNATYDCRNTHNKSKEARQITSKIATDGKSTIKVAQHEGNPADEDTLTSKYITRLTISTETK